MGLNLVATVCVLRATAYSGSQKMLQWTLTWVIPLFGATLVLVVWTHDRMTSSRDSLRHLEKPWLPGSGLSSDQSHHEGGLEKDPPTAVKVMMALDTENVIVR